MSSRRSDFIILILIMVGLAFFFVVMCRYRERIDALPIEERLTGANKHVYLKLNAIEKKVDILLEDADGE